MNFRNIAKVVLPFHNYARNLELELMRKMNLNLNSIVLDGGCGDGTYISELTTSDNVVGIDIMIDDIRLSRGRISHPIIGSLVDIPLRDEIVTTGVVNSVMEHIPPASDSLKDLARVIKRSGKLILTLPADCDDGIVKAIGDVLFQIENRYPIDDWKRLCTDSGFKVVGEKRYMPEQVHKLYLMTCVFLFLVVISHPALKLLNRLRGGVQICLECERI